MQNIKVEDREEIAYRSPHFWKHLILEIPLLSQIMGISFGCC